MITEELKSEAWSSESNLPLVLLEIDHDDLDEPILVVNDKVNITSLGNEYTAYPFDVFLPDSNDSAPPKAKLKIDNVSRELTQIIRTISSPPSVVIKVIRRETPDIIEAEYLGMKLRHIPYDVLTIEGDLEFEDFTKEPYPALTFTPSIFRGIL